MFIKNKRYCMFIIFFYWSIFENYLEGVFAIFQYIDELVALLGIFLWVLEIKKSDYKINCSTNTYILWNIFMILIGAFSSFLYSFQNYFSVFIDVITCAKFCFSIYVGKIMFKKTIFEDYGKKIFNHVKLVIYFFSVLVISDYCFKIFRGEIRHGLRSIQLFYSHPTIFAGVSIFILAVLIRVRQYAKHFYIYFFINLFLICSTLRSKAMVGAFAAALIYYTVFLKRKKIHIRNILIFVPVALLLAKEQIEYYFFSSIHLDSARYQLIVTSLKIAKDYFPLGTGFATFGSATSGSSYSPIYDMYHISNVNGLRKGATAYVNDSFWPMILGQFGWFGLICMVLIIVTIYKEVQKLSKHDCAGYAASLTILAYLLITSMAESAFVHPNSVPMALLLGIIFNQKQRSNSNDS